MVEQLLQDLINYKNRHNLTQLELASLLGVRQSFVSRILNGVRTPSAKVIDKIYELLKEEKIQNE